MDLKDAEKVEWEAMRNRRNRLVIYAADKGCNFSQGQPKPIPSLEEIEKMSKKSKEESTAK